MYYLVFKTKTTMLLQWEPVINVLLWNGNCTYDAVVKFDTYRNLQRHHAILIEQKSPICWRNVYSDSDCHMRGTYSLIQLGTEYEDDILSLFNIVPFDRNTLSPAILQSLYYTVEEFLILEKYISLNFVSVIWHESMTHSATGKWARHNGHNTNTLRWKGERRRSRH